MSAPTLAMAEAFYRAGALVSVPAAVRSHDGVRRGPGWDGLCALLDHRPDRTPGDASDRSPDRSPHPGGDLAGGRP